MATLQSYVSSWTYERGAGGGERSPQSYLDLAQRNGGYQREKRQQVIEKIAVAAAALGWPEQIVGTTWPNAEAFQKAAMNPLQFLDAILRSSARNPGQKR